MPHAIYNPRIPGALSNEARLKAEKLIGTGLTAEVFSWGEECVLKLFFPWVSVATIEREFTITQAIHRPGVPVPAAFEVVMIE